MPKRKRGQQGPATEGNLSFAATSTNATPVVPRPPSVEESARAIAIQQKVVGGKVYHGKILLKRALKTAKGFEQQKLGKRLKNARKGTGAGGEEEKRLEAELDALKAVDLAQLASAHVHKTLKKNYQIANSTYFPPSIHAAIDAESSLPAPSTARMNVAARMYNSNPVKEAVVEVLKSVRMVMEIEEETPTKPKEKKEQKKAESKLDTSRSNDTSNKKNDVDEGGTDADDESVNSDSDEDMGDIDADAAIAKLKEGIEINTKDDNSNEYSGDNRIALSDPGSGSDDEYDPERGRSMSITPDIRTPSPSPSSSLSGSDSDSDIAQSKPKSTSKPIQAPPISKPTTSAFLPSLMSGYISGSSSASSLSDDDSNPRSRQKKKKGPAEKKVRKNRMGQQARRALAEKKFGKEAKHIKDEVDIKEQRKKEKEEKQRKWQERQDRAVHPSWQASMKEKDAKAKVVKEALRKVTGPGSVPVGKKIVFE